MHKMCTECGIHFVGDNKDMIIECKGLRHRILEVLDTWDKGGQPISTIMPHYRVKISGFYQDYSMSK
mgnify:CR=1 FL=1